MTKEQKGFSSVELVFDKKDVNFNCQIHGNLSIKIFCMNGIWSPPFCKQCNDIKKAKQAIIAQELEQKENEKAKQARIEQALGRSGIPLRFQSHSFDTFFANDDDQKKKKNICSKYAENFNEDSKLGKSMIFCGTTGTGKTHLACSIANQIIQNGKTAIFMNVIRAIRQIKETWSKESEKKEQEAINWFVSPDLLILDEIGVQFGSESEKIILFEILNERYLNMKPTILISNLNPNALQEFISERVMDRMRESGGMIVKFDWKSHRGI